MAEDPKKTSPPDAGSDKPGDGRGRRDEVGRSGIYPVSASEGADPDARLQGEASFGQGDRGAAGYEDSGESELNPLNPDREQAPTDEAAEAPFGRKDLAGNRDAEGEWDAAVRRETDVRNALAQESEEGTIGPDVTPDEDVIGKKQR